MFETVKKCFRDLMGRAKPVALPISLAEPLNHAPATVLAGESAAKDANASVAAEPPADVRSIGRPKIYASRRDRDHAYRQRKAAVKEERVTAKVEASPVVAVEQIEMITQMQTCDSTCILAPGEPTTSQRVPTERWAKSNIPWAALSSLVQPGTAAIRSEESPAVKESPAVEAEPAAIPEPIPPPEPPINGPDVRLIDWEEEKSVMLPPRSPGRIKFLLTQETESQTRARIENDTARVLHQQGGSVFRTNVQAAIVQR
jgi:hypothetical protein